MVFIIDRLIYACRKKELQKQTIHKSELFQRMRDGSFLYRVHPSEAKLKSMGAKLKSIRQN